MSGGLIGIVAIGGIIVAIGIFIMSKKNKTKPEITPMNSVRVADSSSSASRISQVRNNPKLNDSDMQPILATVVEDADESMYAVNTTETTLIIPEEESIASSNSSSIAFHSVGSMEQVEDQEPFQTPVTVHPSDIQIDAFFSADSRKSFEKSRIHSRDKSQSLTKVSTNISAPVLCEVEQHMSESIEADADDHSELKPESPLTITKDSSDVDDDSDPKPESPLTVTKDSSDADDHSDLKSESPLKDFSDADDQHSIADVQSKSPLEAKKDSSFVDDQHSIANLQSESPLQITKGTSEEDIPVKIPEKESKPVPSPQPSRVRRLSNIPVPSSLAAGDWNRSPRSAANSETNSSKMGQSDKWNTSTEKPSGTVPQLDHSPISHSTPEKDTHKTPPFSRVRRSSKVPIPIRLPTSVRQPPRLIDSTETPNPGPSSRVIYSTEAAPTSPRRSSRLNTPSGEATTSPGNTPRSTGANNSPQKSPRLSTEQKGASEQKTPPSFTSKPYNSAAIKSGAAYYEGIKSMIQASRANKAETVNVQAKETATSVRTLPIRASSPKNKVSPEQNSSPEQRKPGLSPRFLQTGEKQSGAAYIAGVKARIESRRAQQPSSKVTSKVNNKNEEKQVETSKQPKGTPTSSTTKSTVTTLKHDSHTDKGAKERTAHTSSVRTRPIVVVPTQRTVVTTRRPTTPKQSSVVTQATPYVTSPGRKAIIITPKRATASPTGQAGPSTLTLPPITTNKPADTQGPMLSPNTQPQTTQKPTDSQGPSTQTTTQEQATSTKKVDDKKEQPSYGRELRARSVSPQAPRRKTARQK